MSCTKKQHFIPRMILKHYTCFRIPMRKPMIYQYDKNKMIERLVDISEVCRANNLYELRDAKGNILEDYRNLYEQVFSNYESQWDKIIINKILKKQNLSEKEILMIYLLLVLQLLRTPDAIEYLSDFILKSSEDIDNQHDADRIVKIATFIGIEPNSKINWILDKFLNDILKNYQLIICHSHKNLILNGSKPVIGLHFFPQAFAFPEILAFPITPNFCLVLKVGNTNKILYQELSSSAADMINKVSFDVDSRYIYSSESIFDRLNIFNNFS